MLTSQDNFVSSYFDFRELFNTIISSAKILDLQNVSEILRFEPPTTRAPGWIDVIDYAIKYATEMNAKFCKYI